MSSPATSAKGARVTNITVDCLARVEGEGSLVIKLKGNRVQDIKLRIFEPPRFFEAFLRGRHFSEVPDLVARICGICPIAHQMSASIAIERALGAAIDPRVKALRRLFYCGEWIESHALHIYMLHAPDFLGYQDVVEMARDLRPTVEQALALKKTGNDIVAAIGGREIHPVSICAGGFHRVPRKRDLQALTEPVERALELSVATAKLVSTLPFPDFDQDYEFVALSNPREYAICEGRLVSNKGLDIEASEYEDHFLEQHVKHSNALHSALRERGSYLTGPLARFALNYEQLTPAAKETARAVGLTPPCLNPFQSIVVRAVETVFACEEAIRLIRDYEEPSVAKLELQSRGATGQAITEAPRGNLYHRYVLDENGLVLGARIVPPSAQNLKRMEDDLWQLVPRVIDQPAEEITLRCEQAIRNYDPCISCATHFLHLHVVQE